MYNACEMKCVPPAWEHGYYRAGDLRAKIGQGQEKGEYSRNKMTKNHGKYLFETIYEGNIKVSKTIVNMNPMKSKEVK